VSRWRGLGIPARLDIHAGINTGHCTVGIFGSDVMRAYKAVGFPRERRGPRFDVLWNVDTGRRPGAAGPRQREPDPDADASRPGRRIPLWMFPLVLGSGKRLFADGTIPAGSF
jgi:hypothetical protein